MKAVFGLGNPGRQYHNHRHNVGYMVLDELARAWGYGFKRSFRLSAFVVQKSIGPDEAVLIKPRTYMNNSGRCVVKCLGYYKSSLYDALIIYDDVDLPLGEVRFRKKGSSGGHRGMQSIMECLGTEEIDRLRVGVGKDPDRDTADYVLSDFHAREETELKEAISRAIAACIDWIKQN